MSYQDYLKSKRETQMMGNNMSELLNEVQRLRQELQAEFSPAKAVIFEAKRKKLKKLGINIGGLKKR